VRVVRVQVRAVLPAPARQAQRVAERVSA
jgi:hypothetical protein